MASILTLVSLFVGLCLTFYISFSVINQLLHPLKQHSLKSSKDNSVSRSVDDVMQAGAIAEYHQSTAVVSCEAGINSVCSETIESAGNLAERIGGLVEHLNRWH